ncbi:MAG TPA: hypothetical protein VK894_13090, partial [Jiangellales bacterium]|nr:hypothetical protein [Jiangellales bacterium]
ALLPLLVASMAGFGHAVSEVGAATIVGGNIHGRTQEFGTALVYGGVLLALALAVDAVLVSVQRKEVVRARP